MSARFAILDPCAKRWSDLGGDGRKRFCDECQTDVHALGQYSIEEFAELKRKYGRVCGFLEGESLPEPRSRRAVLIGAFLTAISPLLAQSGRVRIRVIDLTGAVVPDAVAALVGENDKPIRIAYANQAGEIEFADLPMGNSRFVVQRRGFKNLRLTVTLRNTDEVKVQAQLEVATMGVTVPVRPKRHWWQIFR